MSQAEDLLNSLTAPVINHTHEVPDSDKHFTIDPHTKQIKNTNNYKTILMQGDHNSQCLTFELPRYIDGHDMSLCNRVIVHFDNVGDSIDNVHSDVAYMDDLQTNPDNSDTLISSWLIRREATRFAGIISFFIQYQCVEDDEEVTYEWNTDYYSDIEVRKKKENGEAAIIPYTNVLEQWRSYIFNTIEDSIKYTPQTLTPEQQAQARANIGAADVGESGSSILATDDGAGNVVITMTGALSVTDDGNGNVVIS